MATVTSVNFLFNKNDQKMTSSVEGLQTALEEIGTELVQAVDALQFEQGWRQQSLMQQIVIIQRNARAQLNIMGWDKVATKFIGSYNEVELLGKQVLGALGRDLILKLPQRADTIENLKALDLDQFDAYGNQAIRALSKEVALNTIVGKPRSAVIKSMTQIMDGNVEAATQYADTSIRLFDRTVNGQLYEEAGIDTYCYFGPKDKVTRPFCLAHVGKIYTRADIKKMNNGSAKFGNVWLYGGGPRCRHTWQPRPEATSND
jgi:hypothetical protein